MQQQSYPYLCWVDPLNINNKGRRLTRLRIGVTHIPLPNITIVTQKDSKLEIGHGNKSEYTVQMYLEVLCKHALTTQLQRAMRIECWFFSVRYAKLYKQNIGTNALFLM
jgi:hypothetical protein